MTITKKYLKRRIQCIENQMKLGESISDILEVDLIGAWFISLLSCHYHIEHPDYTKTVISSFIKNVHNEHCVIG